LDLLGAGQGHPHEAAHAAVMLWEELGHRLQGKAEVEEADDRSWGIASRGPHHLEGALELTVAEL
jgi:hypothetical protein